MKNNKIIAFAMALTLLFGGVMATAIVAGYNGFGNANVINAAPQINDIEVLDPSWSPVPELSPDTPLYYNVSTTDTDGTADIMNITLWITYVSNWAVDGAHINYKFFFDYTTSTWSQLLPTTQNYLNIPGCSVAVLSPTQANFSFAVTLNKTAWDSNGVLDWHVRAHMKDGGGTSSLRTEDYVMSPLIEMTYMGNAGGHDFLWTGAAESNVSVSFVTRVTSNDAYQLNASYNGSFQAPWGEPTIWIREDGQTISSLIPDWEVTGNNITWYSNTRDVYYLHSRSHHMYLVYPAGVTKATTYTGVTIWIQARND